MNSEVDNQPLFHRESFTTNLAAERFQPGVSRQVSFEGAHLCKSLLTHVTFKPVGNNTNS